MSKSNDTLTDLFARVEDTHWWFVGRRIIIFRALEKYSAKRKGLKILDIGCGTGGTLEHIKQYGTVYGIDPSALCIRHCKQKGLKNIYKSSATKLPFEDATFDVVLMLDVLEHVKNEQLAIDEAKRVLKKNGILMLTIPALPWIWSAHDTAQGHYKRYVAKDMQLIAKRHLLSLLCINYFNFIFSAPIALIRIISNFPFFNQFNKYESTVNLNTSKNYYLNKLLLTVFKFEITLSQYIRYPIGISLLAVYKKY